MLAVVVAGAGVAMMSMLVARTVAEIAASHRARADVQCARLAAHALAALWPDAGDRFADVAPAARRPSWELEPTSGGGCRLVAHAECGAARRRSARTLSTTGSCDARSADADALKSFANFEAAEHYPADVGLHNVRRHRGMRQDDAGPPSRGAPASGWP